jgi:hypothetical protein
MPKNPLNTPMNVDFAAKQREFVAYIRDPENHPAPADVKLPRIDMYRELLFNNIENFLSSNFPVLRKIFADAQWEAMVGDFFAKHSCTSPYFSEIPEEFLAYLEHERDHADDYPFMLELAHYEWVEMAVAISKETTPVPSQIPEDLAGHRLTVSAVAWPLAYQYPVHKIAPDFLPTEPPTQPTFLIVYRNAQEDVQFLEITPLTCSLLDIIQNNPQLSANDCLQQIAIEMQHPHPEVIVTAGLQILAGLAEKAIVTIAH